MSKKISRDKDRYRQICRSEVGLPIFFQDWWLDIVCGKDWEVLIYFEDPKVVAVYTYFAKSRYKFNYVTMPVLTKFMGPFFILDVDSRKEQRITTAFVDALPEYFGFAQTLHYQFTNWLPFRWKGYNQTVLYSYEIVGIGDLDAVWAGIDADYRNHKITKASQHCVVRTDLPTDKLFGILEEPFTRQNMESPYSRSIMVDLVSEAYARGCGKSFYSEDADGNILAAAFIIWDSERCYLLLAGERLESRKIGAGILTIWSCIKYASQDLKLEVFDFLGGMSENLERTRRQFGARQKAYFFVEKYHWLFQFLRTIFGQR